MRSPFLLLGLTSLVLAAVAPSCKTATVIRETFTTNFGCESGSTLSHAVMFSLERTGNPPVFDGKEPVDATRCTPRSEREALIGDLVLRPPTDGYDGTYDLVAIAGTSGPDTAQACNLEGGRPKNAMLGGQACVVARRRVRFVEATEVTQNIFLSKNCAGVVCGEGSSCNPSTSGCTALKENSTSTSGGTEGSPETDGSVTSDNDAGVISDATPDTESPETGRVDAAIQPCNQRLTAGCTASLGTNSNMLDVVEPPSIIAAGRHVAWIRTTSTNAVTEFDFDANVPTSYASTPQLEPPVRLGYVTASSTLRLYAVFRPSSAENDVLMLRPQGTGWIAVAPPMNFTTTRIEGFVGNGLAVGGLYETGGRYVPFIVDSAGAKFEATATTPATPNLGSMMDTVFGTADTGFHYADNQTVYEVPAPAKGAVTARPGVLPVLQPPARLLANIGQNDYIVATNGQVGKTYNGFTGVGLEVLVPDGVVDTATDDSFVYVLRQPAGKNTTSEVLAISRTTSAICRMPIQDDLAAIAVDRAPPPGGASCLYGAKRTFMSGNLRPTYNLGVFRKATP